MTAMLSIEVVFATPELQELLPIKLPAGSTVADAIAASKIADLFPADDIGSLAVGIWGKPCARSRVLSDGDRIEIYRNLPLDPRDARRRLAELGGVMGGQSGNSGAKN